MNIEKFTEIWEDSGLSAYYKRMSDLKKMGFLFDDTKFEDMNFFESEALNEWLGEKTIMDVSIEECEKILPDIKKHAQEIADETRRYFNE